MKRRFAFKVHPASVILFAAAFLFADSHLALAALLALGLHEGAHLMVMTLCGIKGCSVEMTPFGGMMDARHFERYSPWKQFLVSGAGVAASGLTAWSCWALFPQTLFIQRFFQANASLTFLNILPLWPLDGARILTAVAACWGMEQPVKKVLSFLSAALGILLVLLGLYGAWKGIVNPTLLAAGPYLCYASRTEKVTARVRHLENIEHKLVGGEVLPVTMWAGSTDRLQEHFASCLSSGNEKSYQMLIAVDPISGQIDKWWTEHAALNHLLQEGRN